MNAPIPRISEDTAKQVFDRAARLSAQYSKQVSIDELIAAGEAAKIPAEFIEQAFQEITVHKPQKQYLFNWKQFGEAIYKVGIWITVVSGVIFGFQTLSNDEDVRVSPLIKILLYGSPALVATGYIIKRTAATEIRPVNDQDLQRRLVLLESTVTNLELKLSAVEADSELKWEKITSLTRTIEELRERLSDTETNLIEGLLATLPYEESVKDLQEPES